MAIVTNSFGSFSRDMSESKQIVSVGKLCSYNFLKLVLWEALNGRLQMVVIVRNNFSNLQFRTCDSTNNDPFPPDSWRLRLHYFWCTFLYLLNLLKPFLHDQIFFDKFHGSLLTNLSRIPNSHARKNIWHVLKTHSSFFKLVLVVPAVPRFRPCQENLIALKGFYPQWTFS